MLVLVGSAFAQTAQPNPATAGDSDFWAGFAFSAQMGGFEIEPGTDDFANDMTRGKVITLHGESSDFTAVIDSGGTKPDFQNGNKIVSGTWTLTVYKGGELYGRLFGVFTSGSLKYKADRAGNILAEYVDADMLIKGGTEAYARVGGPQTSGKFLSTSYPDQVNTTSDPAQPSFAAHKGEVNLNF
jgi:hypothetical protein